MYLLTNDDGSRHLTKPAWELFQGPNIFWKILDVYNYMCEITSSVTFVTSGVGTRSSQLLMRYVRSRSAIFSAKVLFPGQLCDDDMPAACMARKSKLEHQSSKPAAVICAT